MNNLTPEFFDTLIVVVILIGLALAAVRLYKDFTRPLPPNDDTRPNKPQR
jgi:cytochrome c oxidase assembly protein Cox11